MNFDRHEYYRQRMMALMNEVEVKRNRYHRKENFEVTFPELTEEIWKALDSKNVRALMFLTEKLNKLSDSF